MSTTAENTSNVKALPIRNISNTCSPTEFGNT